MANELLVPTKPVEFRPIFEITGNSNYNPYLGKLVCGKFHSNGKCLGNVGEEGKVLNPALFFGVTSSSINKSSLSISSDG